MTAIASLIISAIALIFAVIAAINQITATKRPILNVTFSNQERVALADVSNTGGLEEVIAASLLIRITNHGHDPMFNPRVMDTTPGRHILHRGNREYTMPHEIGNGKHVEIATCYSLANKYDREISIIWEEFALFHRNPKTRGLRYRVDSNKGIKMNEKPAMEWRRGFIWRARDWRTARFPIPATFMTSKQTENLNRDAVWTAHSPIVDSGIYEWANIIQYSFLGFHPMVNGELIPDEKYNHWKAQGLKLSKDM